MSLSINESKYEVIVRPLSTVGYTSIASDCVIHSRGLDSGLYVT